MSQSIALLAAIAVLSVAAPASARDGPYLMPITNDVTKSIDSLFGDHNRIGPGCALAVSENLEPVYVRAYGLADLDFDVPITPDTAFDLASMSKQFTAMAVIILAHEGKISLDDDIRKYVPEVPVYGAPITIWDLIHHTSGLRDIYILRSLMGLTEKDYFAEVDFLDEIARQKHLVFPTGQKWRYSNTGYLLLGIMVQRVTHETLAQYAQERIFGPLNMAHTFFSDDAMRIIKNRATGYYRQKDGSYKRGVTLFEMVGDGGVVSTVNDLMLWDRDFYEGKVWKPAIKADMLQPGRLDNGQPTMAEPEGAYAGGLIVGKRRGLTFVRHSGSFVGFRTDQIRIPDQKLSVTVLCNQGEIDAGDLADRIADILLEHAYTEPPPPPEAEGDSQQASKRTSIPGDLLDQFAGVYHSDELGVDYRIVHADNTLRVLLGKRETPLEFGDYAASPPWLLGPDIVGDEVFVFRLIRIGQKITGFEMSLVGGSPMTFVRVQ